MSKVSSADHVILLLPFTPSTYLDPAPLLPLIASTLPSSSKSFTILMHTPPPPPRRRSSGMSLSYETPIVDPTKQLYTKLKRNPRSNWSGLHNFLGKMYSVLVGTAFRANKVLLRTEVLFENEDGSVLHRLIRDLKGASLVQLEDSEITLPSNTSSTLPPPPFSPSTWNPPPPSQGFPIVALGGTFDHLHGAHRLLLQLAAFLCVKSLIVGITSPKLLAGKSNAPLVESYEQRLEGVRDFLLRMGLQDGKGEGPKMDLVEINDAFGPTAYEVDIQALVVSRETSSGASEIAKVRKEKDLPPLEIFTIDVLSSQSENATEASGKSASDLKDITDEKTLKEMKMGSSGIRKWIAEHQK